MSDSFDDRPDDLQPPHPGESDTSDPRPDAETRGSVPESDETALPTAAIASTGRGDGAITGRGARRDDAAPPGLTANAQRRRSDLVGASMTWLSGGALAMNLLLVLGIMGLLGYHGLSYFWQKPLVYMETADGTLRLGEVWDVQTIPPDDERLRTRLKVGNRDLGGIDFVWVDNDTIVGQGRPPEAVLLERLEYGNFYGFVQELSQGGQVLARGDDVWPALQEMLDVKRDQRHEIEELEDGPIGTVNYRLERLRLERRAVLLESAGTGTGRFEDDIAARLGTIDREMATLEAAYAELAEELFRRRDELAEGSLLVAAASGQAREIEVGEIVRAVKPNDLGLFGKLGLYFSRVAEFIFDDPREANTEGGIFPAIFGTVLMVFLMTFAVAPLGVLAALYLREYARQGPLVRMVRIAVNNLAGVPSIVFGVFGLGFFVYFVGGTIDQLFFPEALPTPTYGTGGILWAALTLALLTVPVVIVAAEEGLAAVPRIVREGSLALGATKFETIWRVVLPAAAPGILTGMILAMARAAGEVAPLMIVGMVKLAPTLPLDGNFPFIHPERKFMHLGFHIYDLGFQSPNVEAAKPLVFATALLLILIVTAMNLVAIALRNHLRKKYAGSSV